MLICELALGRATEPVAALVDNVLGWFILCEVCVGVKHAIVLNTVGVNSHVGHVLATERTDHVELFQFMRVFVDKTSPLFHFVPCFFIEFILVEVILFLELLRHLPNNVVLELEETALLLIVLNQQLSLSKLTRQIIRVDININFELLGDRVLNVLIQLLIMV